MAAAGGTRKGNEEDEMLAKAIALSLEGEEDKQVKKAINLSLTETSKPVKPPASLMNIKAFGTTIHNYTMYTAQGDICIDFYHNPDKILPKDKTQEPKALFGTITGLNTSNTFGFIAATQPLPKEYKGKSLFFHFDVVKNLSEKKFKIQKGSKVKFVLYKGSFEKPKAFAVFLHDKYQVMDAKSGKKATPEASKDSKKKAGKDNNASALKNIKKQLENQGPSKKVSVFWDIENCRPKRNTILEVVGKIRDLVLQGHQEQSFMVVCDVTEEPKDVISSLEDANVDVRHISRSKKNSSDEVLRQEMRKIVDTSNETGRIVLISGDCDFSKDLHGFRYRKGYEIVLIHNAMAKQALIQCANFAFPFETVLGQHQANSKENKKKLEKG